MNLKFIDYLQVILVIIMLVIGLIIYPIKATNNEHKPSITTTIGTSNHTYYDINNDPAYWWWIWQN